MVKFRIGFFSLSGSDKYFDSAEYTNSTQLGKQTTNCFCHLHFAYPKEKNTQEFTVLVINVSLIQSTLRGCSLTQQCRSAKITEFYPRRVFVSQKSLDANFHWVQYYFTISLGNYNCQSTARRQSEWNCNAAKNQSSLRMKFKPIKSLQKCTFCSENAAKRDQLVNVRQTSSSCHSLLN